MSKLLDQAIAQVRALPENDQEILAARIIDEMKRRTRRRGKWAEVADQLAELNLFQGQSEEFEQHVRELRDGFFPPRATSMRENGSAPSL